ncbi:choice-of-anchor J domain-containing protein [uncultured Winogradskyella sp.]|uniref:T9SS-dependent choice-of-anchor J family protein n=1 Tax=uncultured Winogradskyella sp. TaxID=395353 RepID=UPI0026280D57|nr:choice-of-anchor J domain-containing protein [uncultured Winogradskyella sp.]
MIKKITLVFLLCFSANQLTTAQTYFSDDFSSGDLSLWTLTDSDGDGDNWSIANLEAVQAEHATSASWNSTAGILTPDNWMVSSAIDLTTATGNVFLQWKAYAQDQSWANENYSVYVSTASDIASLSNSSTSFNEVIGATGAYVDRNIDVTSFVGQTIYVAFRHHNVSDQFRINIDDVVVRSVNDDDAELTSINLPRYGLVSTDYPFEITVNNTGGNTISSLDLSWTDGSVTNSATISTNIAGGATATITHPDIVNYSTTVEKTISATITSVNGGVDSNPSNNMQTVFFNTMTQSGTKAVLIEESTGTWCGWCPRGTVGLDYMTSTYPNSVVGIAVHNGDPMTVSEYDTALVNVIGTGWPNAGADRKLVGIDPGQASLQAGYNTQIAEVVPVDITIGAIQTGSNLSITANANFYTSFGAANYRLGVIITEDNVTGTASGYNQTNYYSGGGSGAMGGYENLPESVPAAQMVYNHVGRALLGGFDGQPNSVPTVINGGDIASYTFSYTIPSTSSEADLHIVAVLIDSNDGSIVSAKQSTVAQALSIEEVSGIDSIKLYPNPASDKINIAFSDGNGNYNVTITDMLGRTVIKNNYEGLYGNQNIELPVSQLDAGHYIMNINNGSASYSAKFIINK